MYKGIPDRVRGEAWKKILGVDLIMTQRVGVYEVVSSCGSAFIILSSLNLTGKWKRKEEAQDSFCQPFMIVQYTPGNPESEN